MSSEVITLYYARKCLKFLLIDYLLYDHNLHGKATSAHFN